MVIHPKFIYIHMPKTGGTTVSRFLEDNVDDAIFDGSGRGHQWAYDEKKNYPHRFMFGTIRNPWDWYVSFYEFNRQHHAADIACEIDDFNEFIREIMTRTEGSTQRGNFRHMSNMSIGLCTYQYIMMFCDNPQNVFANSLDTWTELTDTILKLEDLNSALPDMFKTSIFELDSLQHTALQQMGRLNMSENRKHYRDYYNPESIDLVMRRDKYIINKYNYLF